MESLQSNQSRSRDLPQLAAALCVGLLIAGEVALLVAVFLQHRSHRMELHTSDVVVVTPPVTATNQAPPIANATAVAPSVATAPEPEQPVLNPALKIQNVQCTRKAHSVSLDVRLRAQTGEQQFAARAAQVSVEWRLADGTKRLEWLATPVEWENFAVKTLQARYDGASSQLRGYTVKTLYRQQLQDMTTTELSNP